ncbi:hypothetical protein [Mucilaginibacter psychrotolerans]|uniref:Uncharacterized protein n=1 Tax=Mucilaginibacter psychrotolerans TaxID=1524096 RepID=A0A4Y8SBX8_9SPHI|nr:hypothetical protein [Mucilaginibacter psychrotolerans]TFF36392.1 hypothetical protein E2R66_16295 [Mucilaginibacter psychrotolerans]
MEIDDNIQPGADILFQYYKEGKNRALMKTTIFEAINLGKSFDVQAEIVTAKGNLKRVRVIGYSEFKNGKCEKLFGLFQEISIPLPLSSKKYLFPA